MTFLLFQYFSFSYIAFLSVFSHILPHYLLFLYQFIMQTFKYIYKYIKSVLYPLYLIFTILSQLHSPNHDYLLIPSVLLLSYETLVSAYKFTRRCQIISIHLYNICVLYINIINQIFSFVTFMYFIHQ